MESKREKKLLDVIIDDIEVCEVDKKMIIDRYVEDINTSFNNST